MDFGRRQEAGILNLVVSDTYGRNLISSCPNQDEFNVVCSLGGYSGSSCGRAGRVN